MKHRRRTWLVFFLLLFLLCQQIVLHPTRTEVFSSTLPDSFDGFRVVQLSDLHGREYGGDNRMLLLSVKALKPDLIAVTGDLLNEARQIERSLNLLSALANIAPTCYVTGNHEWSLPDVRNYLSQVEATGVTVLANQAQFLSRNGQRIVLAGVHDPNGPRDMVTPAEFGQSLREKIGENIFFLLLAHRNETADFWAATEADLVLAGHAHGGLIRLPFLGGVIQRHGQKGFDSGLYQSGRTLLFVSRGLGGSGIRLLNRPEVALLILRKS